MLFIMLFPTLFAVGIIMSHRLLLSALTLVRVLIRVMLFFSLKRHMLFSRSIVRRHDNARLYC